MVHYTFLAGGFTTFILTYIFDPSHNTLTIAHNTTTGASPSWIALHPTNKSVLYAVNEIVPDGMLQSFYVNTDGSLTEGDTTSSGGSGPTYIEFLSTGEVTGLNYGSPNMSFIPTDPNDPLRFAKNLKESRFVDFPVPEGSPSNPHMSLQVENEVLVPDLGADKIWRLKRNDAGEFAVTGQINIDAGAGPRHVQYEDEILFTIHEKSNTVTAQQISPKNETLPLIANVTIAPQDAPAGTKFAAAELLIGESDEGDTLLFASNRNIGDVEDPRGDSIAILRFVPAPNCKRYIRSRSSYNAARAEGEFTLVKQVFTGLRNIRSMAFSPDGKFLVASGLVPQGKDEASVKVFRVSEGGLNLEEAAQNKEAGRTSFVFI